LKFSDLTDGTVDALRNAGSFAHDLFSPTVRLGVTGLARSGKTVFITSFIHNLVNGGRLPFFDAVAQGRVKRAFLEPQPDDAVPRFDYERHLADLTGKERRWPQSTRRLSQLRLTLEYEPDSFLRRNFGHDRLHVDIVDYPGEWLLDLPLLHLSYEEWSLQTLEHAEEEPRKTLSRTWRRLINALDPKAEANEQTAVEVTKHFTQYLRDCREDGTNLSTVPPGRFLMPGDMEGSPALTFAPLALPDEGSAPPGSLWSMMARRYESYNTHVVKPFFRDHFSRLDRQVVLVDALSAINGGAEAVRDLERALTDILACFRPGANSWLSSILYRRVDRIAFAATKADHLHHTAHDQLEAILARITASAAERAQFAGADVEVLALAAVRATREGTARQGGEPLPCIIGTPAEGEKIGRRVFNGAEEFAIFPGDLPDDPEEAMQQADADGDSPHFVRFRPPLIDPATQALPHIRLDRAMNFLIGDRLA
jgi:uncharacterized protein